MLSICLVWDVVEISWSILGMPIILFLLSPKRPWVRGGGGVGGGGVVSSQVHELEFGHLFG